MHLEIARQNNLSVGQTIQVIHHPWRISGIVASGRLGRLVVPLLKTLQELSGNPDKVNQILVKIDDTDRTNEVVAQLNKTLEGDLQAISIEELASQYSINNLPPLKRSSRSLRCSRFLSASWLCFSPCTPQSLSVPARLAY
jgi:putative ABC transport system permease protein